MENPNQKQEVDARESANEYIPPALRVFSYLTPGGTWQKYSSHYYDVSTGNLVFIDEILRGEKRIWYYRKTVAAGQWIEVEEVATGGGESSTRVN